LVLVVPLGWVKAVAKPPGFQLRTASFNVTVADAIVVMHVTKTTVEFFVEHGKGGWSKWWRPVPMARRTTSNEANTGPRPRRAR
jgi:hypothetical protein